MAVLSITPLMSAETFEGATGCASGSQTWSGITPALAANPKNASRKAAVAQPRGEFRLPHGIEGIALESREAGGKPGHDAEGEQDGDRAHMGDDEIEKGGPPVLDPFVLEEDQKIGGGRHQFPGDQEEQGVVGQDDQEHPGEKERYKRQPGW